MSDWRQLEYESLRDEILARDESERSSVRFYLPAAAAIYTLPYFLGMQRVATKDPAAVYLWIFCAAVASLLVLVMVLSLYWAADGTRKIGTYIKEIVEPGSDGALRWETVVFELAKKRRYWPNETFVVACGATIANLLASVAASITFLRGPNQCAPIVVSSVLTALAVPALWRLMTSSSQRVRYAEAIKLVPPPSKAEPE